MTSDHYRNQARTHVEKGRVIVQRQRETIKRLRELGHDAEGAEGLLEQFERSLAIFEDDLRTIDSEGS
jgi:hypothetical protein